jgi:hypothetical protein
VNLAPVGGVGFTGISALRLVLLMQDDIENRGAEARPRSA